MLEPYSGRNYFPAAQGVEMWYRRLAGRTFRFTLVREGWWGVGDTCTLRVSAQLRGYEGCGDWYPHRSFQLAALPPLVSPHYRR